MTDSNSKELAQASGSEAANGAVSGASLIQMVAEAARDPDIDADKMEKLANLATSLQDREREAEFNRAKIAAIMEMPSISKRGAILGKARSDGSFPVMSRYSKFEDMHRAIMPILAKHGLVLTFNVDHEGQMVSVQPILSHANGFVEKGGRMLLPIDTSGAKNNTQGAGSAASYGKRHSMKAMLNIIEDGEDIDGLGSLPSDQLNDRQARILAEAQEAAKEGTYADFFSKMEPRDRAWMIQSGRHAELGGHTGELGAPEAKREPSKPKPEEKRPAPEPEAKPEGKARQTAKGWADGYIAGLDKLDSLDALADYQAQAADALGRLKTASPANHERCIQANSAAYARLSSGSSGSGQSSATESAGQKEGADSLFPGDE